MQHNDVKPVGPTARVRLQRTLERRYKGVQIKVVKGDLTMIAKPKGFGLTGKFEFTTREEFDSQITQYMGAWRIKQQPQTDRRRNI